VRLAELVQVSRRVAETPRRSEKIGLLSDLLRRLPAPEIEIGLSYLSGVARQGSLGAGPAVVMRARPNAAAPTPALTLLEVDATLASVARAAGPGSIAQRVRLLSDLLSRATASEQEFLLRLLFGELRQGALEGLMHEALASAAQVPLARVRRAAMVAGGLAPVARVALTQGERGLARFALRAFQPVMPMLAQPAEDVQDALAQLGEAMFEWKLDGARVQIHKSASEVRVYSRSLNEVTQAVPEVVEAAQGLPAQELILDGEAIALQRDGRPQPFQVTMRRFGRRLEVENLRASLPLSVFLFDNLMLDGQDLTDLPARERLGALSNLAPAALLVPRIVTADPAAAQAFLDSALARGHEGVMAKSPDSPYEAGSRGVNWLKIKQAHTLDLVVLAAEWGHGRRRGWLSNLHLGARDARSGQFVMLGKTFKGLTDAMLEWQTKRLLALEIAREGNTVLVKPELVVEIAVNELQESPHYPGGLALRFARVKRYRTDKRPEEADEMSAVRALFDRTGGHTT
jgi:DNA ligase-1